MLYNAPRAASINCKRDGICFSLDRACFNHIVKDAAMRKREIYESFLNKVDILDSLDKYEKGKVADCLRQETYKKGEFVIREGECGNTFFFIQQGKACALKKNSSGGENVVYDYKENEYFGELSLLRDEPRAASIKATVSFYNVKNVIGGLASCMD